MGVTFLSSDCISVVGAKGDEIESILHQHGAVKRLTPLDRYDLPPEPIRAMLPLDPSEQRSRLLRPLRLVGTAEIVVQRYKLPADLDIDILVVCARASLDLDTNLQESNWRELISTPGRLVLNFHTDKLDWPSHEAALARASSSGHLNSMDLNVRLVCKRRMAGLIKRVKNYSPRTTNDRNFSACLGTHLFFNGSLIQRSELPTSDVAMTLLCELAAQRQVLDATNDELKKILVLILDGPVDSVAQAGSSVCKWLSGLEEDLRKTQLKLRHLSQHLQSELGQILARQTHTKQDLDRCIDQLSHLRHVLISRLVLQMYTAFEESGKATDGQLTRLALRVDALTEAHYVHTPDRTDSRWKFTLARFMFVAVGLMLLGIGAATLVNSFSVVITALGSALAFVGAFAGQVSFGGLLRKRSLVNRSESDDNE